MVGINIATEAKALVHDNIKNSISELREELDDHLTAINENTDDIHAAYEYLLELDAKMQKIEQKMDLIISALNGQSSRDEVKSSAVLPSIKLNPREQDVFTVIYASEDRGFTTYTDIAKSLKISETTARNCVNGIIEKGVPITKDFVGNRFCLKLDREFKELQRKHNILRIEKDLTLDAFDQSLAR